MKRTENFLHFLKYAGIYYEWLSESWPSACDVAIFITSLPHLYN